MILVLLLLIYVVMNTYKTNDFLLQISQITNYKLTILNYQESKHI